MFHQLLPFQAASYYNSLIEHFSPAHAGFSKNNNPAEGGISWLGKATPALLCLQVQTFMLPGGGKTRICTGLPSLEPPVRFRPAGRPAPSASRYLIPQAEGSPRCRPRLPLPRRRTSRPSGHRNGKRAQGGGAPALRFKRLPNSLARTSLALARAAGRCSFPTAL